MSRGRYRLPERIMREQRAEIKELLLAYRSLRDQPEKTARTRRLELDMLDLWRLKGQFALPAICEAIRIHGRC